MLVLLIDLEPWSILFFAVCSDTQWVADAPRSVFDSCQHSQGEKQVLSAARLVQLGFPENRGTFSG